MAEFCVLVYERQVGIECDPAQRDYDAQVFEKPEFAFQIRAAVAEFFASRLVIRRSAVGRRRYVGARKREAVAARNAGGLGRKAGFEEGPVEKFAGFIAGEHAAGTIGSVGSRSETEDQNAGCGIAERGDGLAPVFVIEIGAAFDLSDFAAMNEIYASYLAPEGVVAPARSTVEVARLPKDALVEIEAIAHR